MMPTGRWVNSMNAHGGWLVLHAFANGSWAVTRSHLRGKLVQGEYRHLTGSAKGDPVGEDLEAAMELAWASASAIAESERLKHDANLFPEC